MLVWKKEYLWLSVDKAQYTADHSTETVANAIQNIEQSYQQGELQFIQLNSEGLNIHKAFLKDRHHAWHDQQGNKLQQWTANQRWEDWLLDLHHRFLLGNTIGLNIAGFSGILLLGLLCVGISLWWPRRRTFTLSQLSKVQQRGTLLRSHGSLGFGSATFIFVVTLTGVILVYPNESRQVLLDPYVPAPQTASKKADKIELDALSGREHGSWLRLLQRSLAIYPSSRLAWVSLPTEKYPQYSIGLQQENSWNQTGKTTVYFDAKSLKMTKHTNGQLLPTAQRVFDFSYPLHTGKLPIWYRMFLSLIGLALFWLVTLGLISYIKK